VRDKERHCKGGKTVDIACVCRAAGGKTIDAACIVPCSSFDVQYRERVLSAGDCWALGQLSQNNACCGLNADIQLQLHPAACLCMYMLVCTLRRAEWCLQPSGVCSRVCYTRLVAAAFLTIGEVCAAGVAS
jgi:hypothetical protein